jgi:ABC-type sugar transport system ATPase subunit
VGEAAGNFSGGNQQKLLLARWVHSAPRVLLVDEPTRGIDIAAKEEVLGALEAMAARGLGVVVVSSELEELAIVSDRVVVLAEGRVVGELDRTQDDITASTILNAAFALGGRP